MKWSPENYVESAVIAEETAAQMLANLELITIKPKVIIDLGCGAGNLSAQLKMRYPNADVFAIEQSAMMLEYAKKQTKDVTYIQTQAEQLPFENQSADLIILNLLLPWLPQIEPVLKECLRVLRPQGLIMLSALGLDTLKEYRDALANHFAPRLMDMHDVGDLLIQQGFIDPVLDVNHITVNYRDQQKLIADLFYSEMLDEPVLDTVLAPNEESILSITYEIIHAHAWMPSEVNFAADEAGVTRIPLASLRGKLKRE